MHGTLRPSRQTKHKKKNTNNNGTTTTWHCQCTKKEDVAVQGTTTTKRTIQIWDGGLEASGAHTYKKMLSRALSICADKKNPTVAFFPGSNFKIVAGG